jgi:hypothetical protein
MLAARIALSDAWRDPRGAAAATGLGQHMAAIAAENGVIALVNSDGGGGSGGG